MSRDFNYSIYDTCTGSITSPEQIPIDIPGFYWPPLESVR